MPETVHPGVVDEGELFSVGWVDEVEEYGIVDFLGELEKEVVRVGLSGFCGFLFELELDPRLHFGLP